MATNLQKHLQSLGARDLHYTNRTMSRGAPLQDLGAVPCTSIADLVASSDVIFLSLSDDKALSATLDGILSSPCDLAGKIVVDTSTVLPASSARAATRLRANGAELVAAPVFGASPVAAQGQLLFIIAGPDAAVEAFEPFVVGVMGRGIIRLGEDVRKASMMKTAGNFVTAGMMELIAEAHVFAEKTGLGSEAMEALFEQQYGPLAFNMSKRLTSGAYMPPKGERPWSSLDLALKDVGHGIRCARESGSRLEVGEVALRHLEEAKDFSDAHGRPLDSSSMYGVLRQQAGLPFETDFVQKRDSGDA
ncbi:putative oxidoreductase YfjR [Lasiodiplodia theobromae]|uniref:Putative oxidoreductase YfjR n=2 Tax=Lasiodiplodia theobromae TaxID=45133 RepID=A0A5N5D5H2_9PEZI|nr:putative oxidoreductase YfjR [Lasiodiplodia theobromae]